MTELFCKLLFSSIVNMHLQHKMKKKDKQSSEWILAGNEDKIINIRTVTR